VVFETKIEKELVFQREKLKFLILEVCKLHASRSIHIKEKDPIYTNTLT
jgi:hypothetical protein